MMAAQEARLEAQTTCVLVRSLGWEAQISRAPSLQMRVEAVLQTGDVVLQKALQTECEVAQRKALQKECEVDQKKALQMEDVVAQKMLQMGVEVALRKVLQMEEVVLQKEAVARQTGAYSPMALIWGSQEGHLSGPLHQGPAVQGELKGAPATMGVLEMQAAG